MYNNQPNVGRKANTSAITSQSYDHSLKLRMKHYRNSEYQQNNGGHSSESEIKAIH